MALVDTNLSKSVTINHICVSFHSRDLAVQVQRIPAIWRSPYSSYHITGEHAQLPITLTQITYLAVAQTRSAHEQTPPNDVSGSWLLNLYV